MTISTANSVTSTPSQTTTVTKPALIIKNTSGNFITATNKPNQTIHIINNQSGVNAQNASNLSNLNIPTIKRINLGDLRQATSTLSSIQIQASTINKQVSQTEVKKLTQTDQLDGINDHFDSSAPSDLNHHTNSLISIQNILNNNNSSANQTANSTLSNLNTSSSHSDLSTSLASINQWHDVCITKDLTYLVTEYTVNKNGSQLLDLFNNKINFNSLENSGIKRKLEPNTAYKFRVAAINACGRGPWSDQSAFVTCQPGFPGAPSNIKISKSGSNAHIFWEPPEDQECGQIKEYSVYLQTKSKQTNDPNRNCQMQQQQQQQSNELCFTQIYCGVESNCVVQAEVLAQAYVDTSSKPAILFRIAAKNEKGYGPATQVRWLQQGSYLFILSYFFFSLNL